MKNVIDAFLPPKNIDDIYINGLIIFDTNILLTFYYFEKNHVNEILNKIDKINNRLWLPYHTLNEFMKKRETVIKNELSDLDEKNHILSSILKKDRMGKIFREIKSEINDNFPMEYIGEKNSLELQSILDDMEKAENEYLDLLCKLGEKKKSIYSELREEKKKIEGDNILDNLANLYENRIGERYTHQELCEISREAIEKSYYTILPGHSREDLNKATNTFGDYINYYSIIDYCKSKNMDAIYVTNDSKEDWGNQINGEFRYNSTLYEDFHTRTGKRIIIIKFDEFINSIDSYINDLPQLSEDTKKAINKATFQNLKDISIPIDFNEINKFAVNSCISDFAKNKTDIFLVQDFNNNIGRKVELLESLSYKYFDGTLEYVKIDVNSFENNSSQGIFYLIKLIEYDEPFKIYADKIMYNTNNFKKYYFYLKKEVKWRIIFK